MAQFPISIRKVEASEAEMLSQLSISTFYETYVEISPEHQETYLALTKDVFGLENIQLELAKPQNQFYFMTSGNKILGYAKTVKHSSTELELEKLYLKTSESSKGLGSEFFHFLESKAKAEGFRSIKLSVYEKNLKAVRFYKKFGFVKTGVKPFTYMHNGSIYQDTDLVLLLSL